MLPPKRICTTTFFSKLVVLSVMIITLVVYAPSFLNDFQRGWDDQWQVLDNPFVTNHSWGYFTYHFANFYHGQYSPVNTLFYMLTYAIAGYSPVAFHSLSLTIHIANTLMVFVFVRRIMATQKQFSEVKGIFYAGFTALMFAIHPMQVESVAWISASKVLLFSFFTLLALLFYMRYIDTGKYLYLGWVMVFYLLAFGSKEQAVILPLTLLTIDYFYGRLQNLPLSFKSLQKPVVWEKTPFFVLALLMWYFSATNNLEHLNNINAYPFGQRLVFGSHSVVVYIFRFLAPVKMYYFYFYPMLNGEPMPSFFWSYPVLLVIIIWFGVGQYRKGNRNSVFGLLFFLVNILLVLHFLPMPRKMITADRYMYLSIIGLAIAGIPFIEQLLSIKKKYNILSGLLLTVWFLAIGSYSFYRTTQWKDSPTVKQNIRELIEKRKAAGDKGLENPVKDSPEKIIKTNE